MTNLNTREELVEFLYGANSTEPRTLVGIAVIGGELLEEAMTSELSDGTFTINYFFPFGDEGEEICVDRDGTILSDYLYY